MNKRLGIVVIFALLVSAIASSVVYRMISSKLGLNAPAATAVILVANRDIPAGTLLTASDLRTVDWRGSAPPRALHNVDDVVGRSVLQPVYEGDPMLESRLAPKGAGGGLASIIPAGMRALAVKVDEVVGVSGFVGPGMKVDVLVAGTPPAAGAAAIPNKVSRIVLQNITVLSAGQNMHKDAEGKPVSAQVVNLLVTPEQAELMNLASSETRIQLVLRNPLDATATRTSGVALAALFSPGAAAVAPVSLPARQPRASRPPKAPVTTAAILPAGAPAERPILVEVLHGSERASASFGGSGSLVPQP